MKSNITNAACRQTPYFFFFFTYLVAILLDILRSSPPIALVIDDTSNGTIRHLSILYWTWLAHCWKSFIIATYRKNISPGNEMYIISRFVHSPVLFLIIKPTRPPTNTPITVAIVSTFSCIKLLNLLLASCLGRVILTVFYVMWSWDEYSAWGSRHFEVFNQKSSFWLCSDFNLKLQ